MEIRGPVQPPPEGHVSRTSKHIAYTLLTLYALALTLIGIVAAIKDPPSDQVWFDLFKSGFLILGGGLTTVVGYYFGSRGIQEAEDRVAIALQEANRAKEEAERERSRIKELEEIQAPTYDEESLALEAPPTGTTEGD